MIDKKIAFRAVNSLPDTFTVEKLVDQMIFIATQEEEVKPSSEIKDFLLANGFIQDEHELTIFRGKKCNVRVFKDHYVIVSDEWLVTNALLASHDLSIYWLVGVLTWHGFIPKDYVVLI